MNYGNINNKLRVNFKHLGAVPAQGEAERFALHVEQFLRDTMLQFFQQNLDEISLADIIRNEKIREKVKAAEQRFIEKNFDECINSSAIAELWVSREFEALIAPVNSSNFSLPRSWDGGRGAEIIRDGINLLVSHVSQLRAVTIANLAGRKLSDYGRFCRIAPVVHEGLSGAIQFVHRRHRYRSDPVSKAEATFCLRYVTDFAIQAQDRLGDGV